MIACGTIEAWNFKSNDYSTRLNLTRFCDEFFFLINQISFFALFWEGGISIYTLNLYTNFKTTKRLISTFHQFEIRHFQMLNHLLIWCLINQLKILAIQRQMPFWLIYCFRRFQYNFRVQTEMKSSLKH